MTDWANGKMVNRGLKPGVDPCRHCGGLHFGSGLACPYLCGICSKDVRLDAEDRCRCLDTLHRYATRGERRRGNAN